MSGRGLSALLGTGALLLWVGIATARLQHAEVAYRAAVEAVTFPRIATADGKALIAASDAAAQRDLARLIGDAGASAGVRLSLTPAAAEVAGVVTLRAAAQGSEASLLRLSAAIEQGPAPIRWTRWSILPDGDGGLRLNAEAAAPWQARNTVSAAGPTTVLAAAQSSTLPARTLFAPSPITGDSDDSTGAPQLVGIVGRLPDDAVALLRLSDGNTRGLRQGEAAEGWTVAAIAADRIRLTHAGRDHVEILPPTADEGQ